MTATKDSAQAPARNAPEGCGLLATLRWLERRNPDKPRIGRNRRLHETYVRLGQDPFLAFPDAELSRIDAASKRARVRAYFLGFFGPYGALPLHTTEEVLRWFQSGDDAFVEFTDIFASRFLELFYRAWADARAITNFDHPDDDGFQRYLLGIVGTGTPACRDRDDVSDTVKLRLIPLAGGRVKSPVRLRQMLQLHFGDQAQFRIEEFVPSWLEFEPDALSCLGVQGSHLGRNVHLGSRARAVGEKITVHVYVRSYEAYHQFLPGGREYAHMRDIVFWYLGQAYGIEAMLWLPQPEVRAAILGENTKVGWMACIAPNPSNPEHMIRGTNYQLYPFRPGDPNAQTRAA